jgi:hypothetical protein
MTYRPISDEWILARPRLREGAKLFGAYPGGYLERARALLGVHINDPVLHGNLFQEWCEAWSRECLRVLKPGGHFVAFGGSRTYHRLACAVEDAGFEIRDQIQWIYKTGFPKSRASLKPAHEPIVLARKPMIGTIDANELSAGLLMSLEPMRRCSRLQNEWKRESCI